MAGVTAYRPEIGDEICERLAKGESLNAICKQNDMPGLSTVYKWLRQNDEFVQNYARAKDDQADHFVEQIIEIADEKGADPNDKRVRVDARKWVASKLKPKKYGDRQTVEVEGSLNVARIPLPAADTEEWAKQHAPK